MSPVRSAKLNGNFDLTATRFASLLQPGTKPDPLCAVNGQICDSISTIEHKLLRPIDILLFTTSTAHAKTILHQYENCAMWKNSGIIFVYLLLWLLRTDI
jgi:hypothetical protein